MSTPRPYELSAFLRGQFLILTAILLTGLFGIPAFLTCLVDRSGRWSSFFQKLWVAWLMRANGIRIRLRGIEHVRPDESYILVSNHASILDIPAIIHSAPFPVRFMAKKSLTWFPVFGWYIYFSGHILVDRLSPPSALKSMRKAISLLRRGISIIVFPEGTRTPDGEVKDFKRGAFLIAQHSKYPVLPVSISGSFEMLPRKGWCFWPGTIGVNIGEPIHSSDLRDNAKGLQERARQIIVTNSRIGGEERPVTLPAQSDAAGEPVPNAPFPSSGGSQ